MACVSRTDQRVPRRDRHGRGPRGPLAWPPVPAMTTRRQAFDELVLDLGDRIKTQVGPLADGLEFAVQEVPATDPAPWEEQLPALGRLYAATTSRPPIVVVHRRPIEARARDEAEIAEIVREVIVEQVAAHLGVPPSELE